MNLIMFDMDGTLFRTETSFFPAVQEFAARHAFPVPDEEFLRSFIGQSGSEWRAWLEQLQLGTSTQELVSEFDLLEQDYVKTQGELYPGAADVLRTLARDGWKLGVCSNAPAWYPEAILTTGRRTRPVHRDTGSGPPRSVENDDVVRRME